MISVDGERITGAEAAFHVGDRGLTLGDGLFETMLLGAREIHLYEAHLARLERSGAALGLPIPMDVVRRSVDVVLADAVGPQVLRVTVTRGPGQRGLALSNPQHPKVIVSASPWSVAMTDQPLRLATVSIRRNPTSPTSTLKTLSYLDSVMALAEAQSLGSDDAMMLNIHGQVGSTSMGNLFTVIGQSLITPPLSDGVLGGIIRAHVLAMAGRFGLQALERSIAVDELLTASEVFATNSVRLVMPIVSLDGRFLGQGDLASQIRAQLLNEVTGIVS